MHRVTVCVIVHFIFSLLKECSSSCFSFALKVIYFMKKIIEVNMQWFGPDISLLGFLDCNHLTHILSLAKQQSCRILEGHTALTTGYQTENKHTGFGNCERTIL